MPSTTETAKRLSLQLISLDKRKLADGIRSQIRTLLEHAQVEVLRVQTNTANIRASLKFTGAGQEAQLAELAGELKKDLTPRWGAAIAKFEELDRRLTTVLSTGVQAPEGDPVLVEMRSKEIRESVKGKSQAELGLMFMNAVESGNDALAWALRNAPVPMLSSEVIAKAEERQSEQTNPREFALRNEAREALNVLSLNWQFLQSWLNEIGVQESSAERIRKIVQEKQAVA